MGSEGGSDQGSLDAAFDAAASLSFDALTRVEDGHDPELLAVLSRWESLAWRQPVLGHRLIGRLAAEACPTASGGKNLAEVLATRLWVSRADARRRIAEAQRPGPRRRCPVRRCRPCWR